MKGIIAVALFLVAASASAEMVNGYFRQNGTYVSPYYRTERDGNPYNNLTPPPKWEPKYETYHAPKYDTSPSYPRYPQPSYPTYNPNCVYNGRC